MKKLILLSCFLLFYSNNVFSQRTITGIVTDGTGEALIGASVILKDAEGVGTSTDIDGGFTITIYKPSPFVLIFSYTGYETEEVAEGVSNIMNVTLREPEYSDYCFKCFNYGNKYPIEVIKPASINHLNSIQLTRDNHFEYTSTFNRLPGIFMETGSLNKNKISIRGLGARSRFSTRKVTMYLNEIPLSKSEGYSTFEEIDMSMVNKVEIWKGSAPSIYGAGLGGLIHLSTNLPNNSHRKNSVSTVLTGGSFGFIRNATGVSLSNKKRSAGFNLVLNGTHNDGYRKNNEFDQKGFTFTGNYKKERYGDHETKLLVSYLDGNALNPFSLDKQDFNSFPKKANDEYEKINAFDKYKKLLLGVTHSFDFMPTTKNIHANNKTSVYGDFRNSEGNNPYSFFENGRQKIGVRTIFEIDENGYSSNKVFFGAEAFHEKQDYDSFNLFEGKKDTLLDNFSNANNTINIFAQSYFEFNDRISLLTGVNVNHMQNTLSRADLISGLDSKEKKSFDWIVSPRLGLTFSVTRNVAIFSSVSHGFSPPIIHEVFQKAQSNDVDIQPEKGWNFEMGVRGSIDYKLKYDLTVYHRSINNFLVPTYNLDSSFVISNSSKTRYSGIESYLEYDLRKIKEGLITYASYSFNYSKFKEYKNGNEDFSENEIPGTPPHHFNLGIDYNNWIGLYGNLHFQYVSAFSMNDENTDYSEAYSLVNLKMGYRKQIKSKIYIDFFVGVRNLTNEKYASLIRVNENNFSSSVLPEYYYPGLPINFYGGVNLRKSF